MQKTNLKQKESRTPVPRGKKEKRMITYCDALNEALHQEMARDSRVFTYGIESKMFGSNKGLADRFGSKRCFATPLSEESMTGFGLGAALNGMRPVHAHIRVDFFMLAMNQVVNMISSYHYGTAGKMNVPMVIRAVIGRGWGQGYQHSKSLHGLFAQIPGLKVVMPTTPYDAKGLLTAAIRDENPVIMLEHRWLYWQEGHVPEEPYTTPIGPSQVLRQGSDVTIIATSWMNVEAEMAAEILARRNVNVEIVDVRTISPFDEETAVESVRKTGRCIVADNDWLNCGFSAEVAARVSQKCFGQLKCPVERIGFAQTPCPTVYNLERAFYPNAETIVRTVEKMLDLSSADLSGEKFYSHENKFKGPF